MRKLAVLLCALMIPLAACSDVREGKLAESVQSRFSAASGWTAHFRVRLDCGDFLADYAVDDTFDAASGHTIVVTDPQSMAGLTVRMASETLSLEYDEAVFLPPTPPTSPDSPAAMLFLSSEVWRKWFAEAAEPAELDGIACICCTFSGDVNGETIAWRTWFDREQMIPLRSEVISGGVCTMILTCDTFTFAEEAAGTAAN